MNTQCTSACGNDYDCPHEYDEVTLKVQHLPSDYPSKREEQIINLRRDGVSEENMTLALEMLADQETKHGEERVPAND